MMEENSNKMEPEEVSSRRGLNYFQNFLQTPLARNWSFSLHVPAPAGNNHCNVQTQRSPVST